MVMFWFTLLGHVGGPGLWTALRTSKVTDTEGAEHFTDLHHRGTACSLRELLLHDLVLEHSKENSFF